MATVSSATSLAASSSATTTNTSAARIADNFDQFLSLLTTQLKNQSPLDPLDTNQFTQQLVQFASVEQQIKTNDNLNSLLLANRTSNVTNALGFVGARVTADGNTTVLKDGSAAWQLDAPRAGTAEITIKDKNGNVMLTRSATMSAGEQSFAWDGKKADGSTAPDGEYTISIAAKDAAGTAMTVSSEFSGLVDGVDVTGTTPILEIGGLRVPVSSVKSIRRTA